MSHRRHTIRLYPNKIQQKTLNMWFGHARYIWNKMLESNVKLYDRESKFLFAYDMINLLPSIKQEHEWLKEIPAQALQQKCRDLDYALKQKINKNTGFPKFKSKNTDMSGIRFPQDWQINDNRISIPKLKNIKYRASNIPEGKLLSITIFKDKCGLFFGSILLDQKDTIAPVNKITSSIGVDIGISNLAALSNGMIFTMMPEKYESRKTKKLQNSLSKKKKFSKNKEKARIKLAKHNKKISNRRKDKIKKIAASIAKNADLISLETLKINEMKKNHLIARHLANRNLYYLTKEIEWQAKKRGKHVSFIDRWFPSSKTCSCCGTINKTLTLSDRTFKCQDCGFIENRDINAAINISNEGLRIFKNTAGTAEIYACQAQLLAVKTVGAGILHTKKESP